MEGVSPDLVKNTTIKDMAINIISMLPDQANWDDIMYEIYVRQKIEQGLKSAREGRVMTHEDVKKRFGINWKIEWTEPAVKSLDAIHKYIAKDSKFNAARFIERILVAVENLYDQPLIGRKVPEADDKDIREIIFQTYRIIYKIETHKIPILAVIHCSRNLSGFKIKPWE